MSICEQLSQHGLIRWMPIRMHGFTVQGDGKILAGGIDVVESEGRSAPLVFEFPMNQHITFNSPANVQIGSHNIQNIDQVMRDLIQKIETSEASDEHKQEAKGLLRSFLEHPITSAVTGGLAGSLGGLLTQGG